MIHLLFIRSILVDSYIVKMDSHLNSTDSEHVENDNYLLKVVEAAADNALIAGNATQAMDKFRHAA